MIADLPAGWTLRSDLKLIVVRSWSDVDPAALAQLNLGVPEEAGKVMVAPGPGALPLIIKLAPRRWILLEADDAPPRATSPGALRLFDQTSGHAIMEAERDGKVARQTMQRLVGTTHAPTFEASPAARRLRIGDVATLVLDDGAAAIRFIVARSYGTALAGWLRASAGQAAVAGPIRPDVPNCNASKQGRLN